MTVIEAKELLGTFDGSLREYAARKLVAQGVKLRRVSRMWCCRCPGRMLSCDGVWAQNQDGSFMLANPPRSVLHAN